MTKLLTRDEQAFRNICCAMVGVHFTPAQAEYLKRNIDMLTWPISDSQEGEVDAVHPTHGKSSK